jgi:hypothetical protein
LHRGAAAALTSEYSRIRNSDFGIRTSEFGIANHQAATALRSGGLAIACLAALYASRRHVKVRRLRRVPRVRRPRN